MRVTVSHNKSQEDIKQKIERGFDGVFQGLPTGPVEISDQQRNWNGNKMDYAFTARSGFMSVPIKGSVEVEETQLVIEIELPAFLRSFLPDDRVTSAVENNVRGLLA